MGVFFVRVEYLAKDNGRALLGNLRVVFLFVSLAKTNHKNKQEDMNN